MGQKLKVLRVQRRPYIAYSIMYGLPLFLFPYVIMINPDKLVGAAMYCLYILVVGFLFAGLCFYRIELFEDVLINRGLKFTKQAPVSAIKKLRMEVGWPNQKWLWAPTLRPFRRLAVYYVVDGRQHHLDISLNHFQIDKVRELLEALLNLRPDLAMPKNFPKQK